MNTGKQLTGLLLLTTALTYPAVAHAQDSQTTDAVAQSEDQVDPEDDAFEEPEISVPGGSIIVTGRRNRDVTRSSSQVISVLSQE